MANPFVGYDNIIPLLAPVDIASTANTGAYMDLKNAQKAAFLIMFGAITSTTATDAYTITIECATGEDGTEATIAYRYRLSGAVGANTWGAVTSVGATGTELTAAAGDSKWLFVEIDPDELAANDYRYARVVITDNPDMEAGLVAVHGVLEARYKQTTHISATASASA